jgi:hypothetical protein
MAVRIDARDRWASTAGMTMSTRRARVAASIALLALYACEEVDGAADAGSDASTDCLAPLDLDCSPSYHPTFEQIHQRLIQSQCGVTGASGGCHGPESEGQGGLVLDDPDVAYEELLGISDGRARVVPGDPECSILVQRIESNDPSFRMPSRAARLPEGVRCAIRQWIANGAKRE